MFYSSQPSLGARAIQSIKYNLINLPILCPVIDARLFIASLKSVFCDSDKNLFFVKEQRYLLKLKKYISV